MMDSPIYLDYNGTCPIDDEVQQAISKAMKELWENPSNIRGGGKKCKAAIQEARQHVAMMLHASTDEIVFTSGGTEANNMVIYSALREFEIYRNSSANRAAGGDPDGDYSLKDIPHIITTNVEHDSIAKILKQLESENRCSVTRVPVDFKTGAVTTSEIFNGTLRPETCLITMMWANNETGVLMPITEISKELKEINPFRAAKSLPPIRLHTDAAQIIGKLPVEVCSGGAVDYLTVVGHKFYGPRIGALYVRNGAPIHPLFFGGGQEKNIRPGTENTPMIVGLGKAAEIVRKRSRELQSQMRRVFRDYLEDRFKETFGDDVQINFGSGVEHRLPNTSSITFKRLRGTASDLLASCPRVIASTGATCHSGSNKPSPILLACGIPGDLAMRTIRFSVGRGTTRQEIDDAIHELESMIGKMMK